MDINDLTWNPWHGCHKCSEGCHTKHHLKAV